MANRLPSEFDSSRNLRMLDGGKDDVMNVLNQILERLPSDGSGSNYSGMERVAKLEARADNTDQRLGRIEDKLDRVLERLGSMPTTAGLWGMIATVIGVSVAMVGAVLATVALFA